MTPWAAAVYQNKLRAIGVLLLIVWAAAWAVSSKKNQLAKGYLTSVPYYLHLGCDFDINYYAVRTWFAGGNPYQEYIKGGGQPLKYDHPPIVLVLFSWCNTVPHHVAMKLWLAVQAGILALAAIACWRTRTELCLFKLPLALLAAATLWSYPAIFEMERGNWNSLVLLLLLLAAWSLRGQSANGEYLAGLFAGLAAWIKVYPLLFLLGLLALKRWRASAVFVAVVFLIAVADFRHTHQFALNIKESARETPDAAGDFYPCSHTFSGSWSLFCKNAHLRWASRLPGTVGWGLLVFPLAVWVSYQVARIPDPSRLLYPYFLWLIALATYLPAIANDYNLIFLPLAALAVWDGRDKSFVHVLMAFMLLWWQPLALPVSAKFLWYCKLLSLGAVALSLVQRAKDLMSAHHFLKNSPEATSESLMRLAA